MDTVTMMKMVSHSLLQGDKDYVHSDQLLQTVLVAERMHSVTNTVPVNVCSTTPDRIVTNTVDHAIMHVIIVQVLELSTVSHRLCAQNMLHSQQLHTQLDVRAMLIILPHTAQYTEVIVTLGALSAMDQAQTSVNSASTMQYTYR